jgi:hypothetical protein
MATLDTPDAPGYIPGVSMSGAVRAPQKRLDAFQRRFVLAAIAIVLILYSGALFATVSSLVRYRASDLKLQQARMSATGVEPGSTPPDHVPASGDFVTVTIGTYIDTITGFSIRESNWSAEFYAWFKWVGRADLDPGRTLVLVDGNITNKHLLADYHSPDGVNYQRYRIAAKFQKMFTTGTVPLDRPMLNIYIEDGQRDVAALRYVVDPQSNVSSRARIAGYAVTNHSYIVKAHTYRSCYGDPRRPADDRTTFSQYIAGITLHTTGLGVYFKIFLCLYAALAFALAAFFIHPDMSPRFSLPAGSYFGVVANSYIINAILPPSNTFGLVDVVITFGLGTIFLTVLLSLISKYLYNRGEAAFARALDRAMFYTVTVCALAANIAIPMSIAR